MSVRPRGRPPKKSQPTLSTSQPSSLNPPQRYRMTPSRPPYSRGRSISYGVDRRAYMISNIRRTPMLMNRRGRVKAASVFYKKNFTKEEARKAFDASDESNSSACVPVVNSLGNFISLNLYDNFSFATTVNTNQFVVMQFNPFGGSMVYFNSETADATATTFRTFSNLQNNIPSTIRASRKSLSISTLMNENNIAGSVAVLAIPNFLDYAFSSSTFNFTTAFVQGVRSLLESSSQTQVYPAGFFKKKRTFSLYPASYVNFSKFHDFNLWTNLTETEKRAQWVLFPEQMPQTTLILQFMAVSTSQTYSIQVNEQIGARYPANTILSSLHRPGLTTTAQSLQAAASAAGTNPLVTDS